MDGPPHALPFRANAYVADAKLTGYLLNEGLRRTRRDKVGLVVDVLGFRDPPMLRAALYGHAQDNPAFLHDDRGDECIYNVVGPLEGPVGRVERLVTAWLLERESTRPRFVTLFPAPRRGSRIRPW